MPALRPPLDRRRPDPLQPGDLAWQEQTLLNIVKMRYVDTLFFVDIPQITSGYTIQSGATTNAELFPPINPLSSFAQQLGGTLNLQAAYQDRPTISYTPQPGRSSSAT